jgi:hypothetical protein
LGSDQIYLEGRAFAVEWGSLTLLVVGLILTIVGWFFDRLVHFPVLERLIDKEACGAIDALGLLASDDRCGLLPELPGFRVIIAAWPNLSSSASASIIARSVAFVQFGPTVENHFELIARSAEDVELPPRWRYAPAMECFKGKIERRVFWLGTVVFWIGIALSLVAGLMDLE